MREVINHYKRAYIRFSISLVQSGAEAELFEPVGKIMDLTRSIYLAPPVESKGREGEYVQYMLQKH